MLFSSVQLFLDKCSNWLFSKSAMFARVFILVCSGVIFLLMVMVTVNDQFGEFSRNFLCGISLRIALFSEFVLFVQCFVVLVRIGCSVIWDKCRG